MCQEVRQAERLAAVEVRGAEDGLQLRVQLGAPVAQVHLHSVTMQPLYQRAVSSEAVHIGRRNIALFGPHRAGVDGSADWLPHQLHGLLQADTADALAVAHDKLDHVEKAAWLQPCMPVMNEHSECQQLLTRSDAANAT